MCPKFWNFRSFQDIHPQVQTGGVMFLNIKWIFVAGVVFFLKMDAFASLNEPTTIPEFLAAITLGNDGFYNRVVSPSKSLNLNQSASARTLESNNKISDEVGRVLETFERGPEEMKAAQVRATVSAIDPKIISSGGANMQFFGSSPSGAYSRVLILISKNSKNSKISQKQLLASFSSYKRSAILGLSVYEYSDARNISQSRILTREGSNQSWKPPQAASEIAKNQDLVLKKCRQIFGWKCVTSLYRTGDLRAEKSVTSYFYAGVYDLINNQDSPMFSRDARSTNQITGSTAFYVFSESNNWIMLYGIDSQWNTSSVSFASLIEQEYQKDFLRLKERISGDMQIPITDLK